MRIELKNCFVRVIDGSGVTGAVNDAVGPTAGALDIDVDGFSAIIPTGRLMRIAGSKRTYTITNVTGGATPTNIEFTPALATADGIPVDNAVVTILGNALEVKVGDGDVEYTETKNYEYDLDRGLLDDVREGDEAPLEVSFAFKWDFIKSITGATTPTLEEAFKQTGAASTWISSDPDQCRPYAVDVEVEHRPRCDTDPPEIITFPDFRREQLRHSIRDSQISVSGKCNTTEALSSRLE